MSEPVDDVVGTYGSGPRARLRAPGGAALPLPPDAIQHEVTINEVHCDVLILPNWNGGVTHYAVARHPWQDAHLGGEPNRFVYSTSYHLCVKTFIEKGN